MKRIIVRSAIVLAGVVVVAVAGAGTTISMRWKRTFEAPYPDIVASTDPAIIAKGAYLAYGPAHCAYCHTPQEDWPKLTAGEPVPMRGGFQFPVPFGTFFSRNLTPDETGIGKRTDGELARVLRYGVHANGRVVLPFMGFAEMSDEDLSAVISYLRAQPPVRNVIPDPAPNALGKMLYSFVLKPVGPINPPPKVSPPEGATVERGKYLANNVAACSGCHTNRSMTDGKAIGPEFAGGFRMDYDLDPTKVLVTPNLTPDPATGHITNWTEDQFLARMRAGDKIAGTHMPWKAYGRMSDDDIRGIYRYLRTLPPQVNATGDFMQLKKPEKS